MASNRKTYYDDLGVSRKATPAEIERAYKRYRADMDLITAAPDRPREARMKAAHEMLSNPERRAQYDAMLAQPERKPRSKGLVWLSAGLVVLAGAGTAAYLLRPPPPPPPGTLTVEEITRAASRAMGRVESTDMSGKAAPIGLAFDIDENTMATSCTGITPMSQLTVRIVERVLVARVAQVDEQLGVCKLTVSGVGSWPLSVSGAEPKPGDVVYVTKMNAVGEVGLVEAKVKRVVPSPRGKVIETSVAVLPERQGGPVLDTHGRVIGVAMLPDAGAGGEVVRVTPDWAARPKAEAPPAPPPAAAPPAEAPKASHLQTREEIQEERRKRLEEAVLKNVR
ncbi:MAG: trypsin-like peptidase domain-containing protein [Burkholderiales bacterium]|nr:trypsin-like peptidase domain-containing protein [Burkholderiales bacterium]